MAIGSSLIKRKGSDNWQLRLTVPKALQDRLGREEVWRSMKTSDKKIAAEKALEVEAVTRAEWRAMLSQQPQVVQPASLAPIKRVPTEHELEATAVLIGHDFVREREGERRKDFRGKGQDKWRRYVARTEINVGTQAQLTASNDFTFVRSLADDAIETHGWHLPRDSDAYTAFCDFLNTARLSALKVEHERALGNLEAESDSKLVTRVRERDLAKAKPGETILELFERWTADCIARGEKRADTSNQDRKIIEQFAAFVGENRAIQSITPIEVCEWRDTMRQLPTRWRDNKQLKGVGMREAAAKARSLELPETAFTTINKALSTVSPLFKWLARQPAWAGLANPVDGLFYHKVKGKNPRPPFTTKALNTILHSPLFTGFLADRKEHLAGNSHADDWRKWVPLICMMTGARIGEICQLRVGDVRRERGVWFIHICHDEATGVTTKSGKSRPAAVHSILEKLGFLDFHQQRLEATEGDEMAPLFPELKPNRRGQISGKPARWWRDYLKRIGVKDGGDGLGAHSFRHTLADRLRSEAELLDDQIEVALGHNQDTTTGNYGVLSQGTVSMHKGWMDMVRFEGVDFGHLIVATDQ